MDLRIDVKNVSISPISYQNISVELIDIDENDLDNTDVAKCISIETFIKVHNETEILKQIDISIIQEYLGIEDPNESI